MRSYNSFLVLCFSFLVAFGPLQAQENCRIAFDIGSSGIRTGSTISPKSARTNINYLDPIWEGLGIGETITPTIVALRDLPNSSGFPEHCARVAGSFSAWRLALEQNPSHLVQMLERVRQESGVAILVIPQLQEGAYGYVGAQRQLGEKLRTSHILDIGGGSLQIAGQQHSYGEMLGQKAWRRALCQALRQTVSSTCTLQPLKHGDLATARSLALDKLHMIEQALPFGKVTMTAISRPVTRGIFPAMKQLFPDTPLRQTIRLPVLTGVINDLAPLTLEETIARTKQPNTHIGDLIPTMLLVEALLQTTGTPEMQVAEIDLDNLSGLLGDEKAYAWERHYNCYLDRLLSLGTSAYDSDPTTCPEK